MRYILILSAVCGFVPSMALVFAQQSPQNAPKIVASEQESSYLLNLRIYEKKRDSVKTLADPVLTTISKRPFSFELVRKIQDFSPALESGVCVDGTLEKIADDRIQVALKISTGKPIKLDDTDICAVKSRSIDLRMNVARSTTKSVQIDAVTWCDIRID